MKLTPALTKAVTETKYLSADNHTRYRLIMRFFYINHERINYWLNADEVYEEVKKYVTDYGIEDCRQDLDSLVQWGNLINDLDTDSIYKLQEFKNKKFRYQMSDFSVEIERLTVKLESSNVEGSSLDIGLIGTIRVQIEEMRSMIDADNTELNSWWRALSEGFKRLNREYQDYMKSFSFLKREDSSTAKQFVLMKDDIIRYLRSFVKGIQKDGGAIARELAECEDIREILLERLIDYELSIPRINGKVSREYVSEDIYSRYDNLYKWFTESGDAGMEHIMSVTNSVIRNLTGYAAVLAENVNSMASRREEYRQFARMFMKCEDTNEAHCLSSLVFGLMNTCHIATDKERETESIASGVYDEEPTEITIKPRVTTYRQKQQQSAIRNKSEAKGKILEMHLKEAERSRNEIKALIKDGKIIMEELPVIDEQIRKVLLGWISGSINRDSDESGFKTEYGWSFKLIKPKNDKRFTLRCTDGELVMPSFILDFEEAI